MVEGKGIFMIMDGKELNSMSNNNQQQKLENRLRDQLDQKRQQFNQILLRFRDY